MTKIIIATHHKLAKGFQDTLDYIAPNTADITVLTAYVDNEPIEEQIEDMLMGLNPHEPAIVFTDMLGGSVNQEFTKRLSQYRFHLITGLNFSLLLSLALKSATPLTDDDIREAIDEARTQMIYMNDFVTSVAVDEGDE